MRFHFSNTARPKAVAKALRDELGAEGIKLPMGKSLEVVAKVYGYRDWKELCGAAGTTEPSLSDLDVDQDTVASRRLHHVEVIAQELGLTVPKATRLIEKIRPTASGRTREAAAVRLAGGHARRVAKEIVSGETLEMLGRAAHGIALKGDVTFIRLLSRDVGFSFVHPDVPGRLEHLMLSPTGLLSAFRTDPKMNIAAEHSGDIRGFFKAIRASPIEDVGEWLDGMRRMADLGDSEPDDEWLTDDEVRVWKVLRRVDLGLIAALAFWAGEFGLNHRYMVEFEHADGRIDGWVRLLWKYPALLVNAISRTDGPPEEVIELFRDYPGDPATALADYSGDEVKLRHRAARFLNKAARSEAVARSADPFRTARAMISDRRNSIPYEQERFDIAFAALDGIQDRLSPSRRAE